MLIVCASIYIYMACEPEIYILHKFDPYRLPSSLSKFHKLLLSLKLIELFQKVNSVGVLLVKLHYKMTQDEDETPYR